MIKPSKTQLQALLAFLETQPRDFRPVCRWLVLGPDMASSLFTEFVHAPELDELLDLVRLVERRAPDLIDTVSWLVAGSPHARQLRDEIQLDQLLAGDLAAWNHPVQVLTKPRSRYEDLLRACRRRQASGRGSSEPLEEVAKRLQRAAALEEQARRRRQEYRRRQRLEEENERANPETRRADDED